jgi:MarR family transcriptional regulator for hemolysin
MNGGPPDPAPQGMICLDIRYHFSRTMGVTNRRWTGLLDKRLRKLGLTGSRWYALVELSKTADKPSQRELAARLGIEAATLVRILDGLAKEGLVKRLAHDTDRRTNQVEITPAGQAILAEISAISAELRNELLQGVDDADLEVCLSVFSRIQSKLTKI